MGADEAPQGVIKGERRQTPSNGSARAGRNPYSPEIISDPYFVELNSSVGCFRRWVSAAASRRIARSEGSAARIEEAEGRSDPPADESPAHCAPSMFPMGPSASAIIGVDVRFRPLRTFSARTLSTHKRHGDYIPSNTVEAWHRAHHGANQCRPPRPTFTTSQGLRAPRALHLER